MLKKIGIALLGLMAAVVLALVWYGLFVGLGFIGTQLFGNALFPSDSLYWRGMRMIGYLIVYTLFLAGFVVWLRIIFFVAHLLGEGALFFGQRLLSKIKKARA